MKLFIYEHITSGALINQVLPASLEREGDMMLHAIISDFIEIKDIEIVILRDARISELTINHANLHCHSVDNTLTFQKHYQHAIQTSDYVLPIAPETDSALLQVQQSVLAESKRLLGCLPMATMIATDKYRCYQTLSKAKLSTPKTILASEWSLYNFDSQSGYIIKPRDGAGCEETYYFNDPKALTDWLNIQAGKLEQFIIQPYIVGTSISLSLLCSKQDVAVLAINQQHVTRHGNRFKFEGCTVNGVSHTSFSIEQATLLAKTVDDAIAGLQGFVGIDLILQQDNNAMIVDINPRLTTSYIGLHQSLGSNPAELLLSMINSGELPAITHRQPIEILL